jgi:hypothetical protein
MISSSGIPPATDLAANLTYPQAPLAKLLALAFKDILIENDHAETLGWHSAVGIDHRLSGKADCFGDCRARNAAVALFDDVVPTHAGGDQFQHVTNQQSCPTECRFAAADLRIGDNKSPGIFLTFRHWI